MLGCFFLVPFAIMVVVSFYHRPESGVGTYEVGFELTHYLRFFSPLFARHILITIEFAAVAAMLSVLVGFPSPTS